MTKMRRRKTLLFCIASVCTLALSVSVTAQDRAKQIGGKFMCMCNCNQVLTQCNHVGSVSYTHLDVYKRQVLTRAAAPNL